MIKRMFLWVVLLVSAIAAQAQTEQHIYTKAEQKAAQKRAIEKRIAAIQDSIQSEEAFNALKNLDFVLEANRLSFKRGETAYVTSNTNFVSLKDDKIVIQIAPFYGGGPNGVGGITLEGTASNIKLNTDKKGNVNLTLNAFGSGLSATVNLFLPKHGYTGYVSVDSNLRSGRVMLYGTLLPSEKSSIFKGRALL